MGAHAYVELLLPVFLAKNSTEIYPYTQLVCTADSCFMAKAGHFCHGPMHKVLSFFNTYYINIIEWTIKLAT